MIVMVYHILTIHLQLCNFLEDLPAKNKHSLSVNKCQGTMRRFLQN
jgi:hypothetical protein